MVRRRPLLVYVTVIALSVAITMMIQTLYPFLSDALERFYSPDSAAKRIVRSYIRNHPYEIMAAFKKAERQAVVIRERHDEVYDDTAHPILGNPDAAATIVAFIDYRCDYCRASARALDEVLSSDAQVRVILRDFPVLEEDSHYAARVALAVERHGRYLDFFRAVFRSPEIVDQRAIDEIVAGLGLDPSTIRSESRDPSIEETILQNKELADALLIEGTPSFVMGDQVIQGALSEDEFKSAIAELLQPVRSVGR